ncbi:MAG: hypothetical protein ACYDAQ_20015, partial [Mycobacteriales bacterium]
MVRLLGLVLIVLVVRRDSRATFAAYNYLLVLSAAVGLITDVGVAAVAGREVARGELSLAAAARGAARVQVATCLLGGLGVAGMGLLLPGPVTDHTAVALAALLTVIVGWFNFQAELLRGAGRPWTEAGIQVVGAVTQVGLGAWVVLTGGGLALLIGAQVVRQLLVTLLSQLWLPLPWQAPADPAVRRFFLRRGLWLGGASTCTAIVLRFGQIALASVAPAAQVASYALATRYME